MTFPEAIDLVVYINLNTRTDRRQEMEAELKRLQVPPEKILRWEATRLPKNGALGCTMSHIAVLEYIQTLPDTIRNILVLEDDFNFADDAELVKKSLNEFLSYPRDSWDLALLSYAVISRDNHNDLVSIALVSSRTSGYLINRSSVPKVLSNFKEGRDLLIKHKKESYNIDRYWWRVMKDRKTFYFNEALGHQRESYSNITSMIEKRESVVSYIPEILLGFWCA